MEQQEPTRTRSCKATAGAFELMFNIQLGKAILAFLSLVIFNEVNYFLQMVQETGPVLLALGVTGAMGQVFIFVTIAKFGALACSLIGLWQEDRHAHRVDHHLPASGGHAAGHRAVDGCRR